MTDISNSLIFIVDDDPNVANVVAEMVCKIDGVKAKVFHDDSFLDDPDLINIDLLIIDNVIPGSRLGMELACEASKIKFCPILFISGYDFDEIKGKQYLDKIEVFDFIPKPMSSATILQRVKSLLRGMKYTYNVIKDKEAAENRFWALLKNIIGIYCIFTTVDGSIIFADDQFIRDIGLENSDGLKNINIHNILTNFKPDTKADRQELVSQVLDVNGNVLAIAKWYTWYINSNSNLFLTIGIPIISGIDDTDSIYSYYKTVIDNDRAILNMLKKKNSE